VSEHRIGRVTTTAPGPADSSAAASAKADGGRHVPTAIAEERSASVPRRWTAHRLNSGAIFNATCRGVAILPREVSYGIGHVGTWLAWRTMAETREALVDNLRALFPHESGRALQKRALQTMRSYARDVIDFLRASDVDGEDATHLFRFREADGDRFRGILSRGRGMIFVSGHYGNWEVGSIFMRRVLNLPLTILSMDGDSEEANRIRRDIRDRLGIATIEVRKSLDTALQIRRHLGENRILAMLMDRHVGRDRVDVSFLGRQAGFLKTPALMAYLTGAPLVPCFIERRGPATFELRMGDPIEVRTALARDEAIREAAQNFADQLGARIKAAPHYWYQFYPYWRSQLVDPLVAS
jgi:KDO2-lipid IV(A) lauroyltransferase